MDPKRHPVLTVVLTLLTTALILPVLPASAAVSYLSTLAGPSVAAMYDSGLEFDDANNRIVVADTGLDRILFYDLNGNNLGGGFGTHGAGAQLGAPAEFDSPRDVAIGPNSMIFVADAGNNRVQAFDSAGNFMWSNGGTGACDLCLNTPIGVTYDPANNMVLIASTGQDLIKAFNINGTFAWRSPGVIVGGENTTLGINAPRDVNRGPDGRLWVSDYDHHLIKAFDVTAAGVWTTTPAITLGTGVPQGHGDGDVNFPYNVDFSLDGNTVYVSDTGNNRVAMWNIAGAPGVTPTWIGAFGGNCPETPDTCADPPADFGFIDTLRRVVVAPDGTVITADFWGNGIQTWTAGGLPIREIELVTPPVPGFAQAFGVATAADGSVYVMDRLNQRLQRFNAAGVFQNSGGNRGTGPGKFSWPEAVAVAPDGSVWTADTRNDRIQKWPADLATTPNIPSWGSTGVFTGTTNPGRFNYIEDLDVGPNGIVYIVDTRNDRIQNFNPATSTFGTTPFGQAGSGTGNNNTNLQNPQGVAVSATNIFVADTDNNRIRKFDLNGLFVATYGTLGSGATQLDHPNGIALDPDGSLWVADTNNNRIVHLSANLVNLNDGFGSSGTGDMQFDLPHTLAVSGNKLYVADTFNNRVQVFNTGAVSPDTTLPTVTITVPSAGQSFPQGVISFSGTAGDNIGVTAVRVGIQNTATSQWYQSNGTWGPTQQLFTTVLGTPGGTSTTWSYNWTPPAGAGSYSLLAESADAAGNLANPKPTRAFTVTGAADTTAPTPVITVPTAGQVFPNAPITFSGTATDNVGVTIVRIAIKDTARPAGQNWWRVGGTWGAYQLQTATLGTAGATSTTWSYNWTPTGVGNYSVLAEAVDAAGNITPAPKPTKLFSVNAGTDTTKPTVVITAPTGGQVFPNGPVGFTGTATDNVGVTTAKVAIKDTARPAGSNWWRSNGTWGAYELLPATVASPGSTSTTWSFTWTPPTTASSYSVTAQSGDAAGNTTATPLPTRLFSVQAAGGGGPTLNATYNRQVSNAGGIAPLYPAGGATDTNGDRYIADSGGSRIVKITSAGAQTTISDVTNGWNDPRDIEFDVSDPTALWVTDTSDSQIVKMSTAGAILAAFPATAGTSMFLTPYGLANDATGVYVADTYNMRVRKINKTTGAVLWTQTTCFGTALKRPRDVAVGSDGNVYVADTDNNRVLRLNPSTGACLITFGTVGSGTTNLRAPRALTSDGATGLWIADAGNNRVKHMSNTGAHIGQIGTFGSGNAQFRSAHCVFLDGTMVDVCDTFAYRIQRFTVNGSGVPVFNSIVGGTPPANGGFNGAFDVAYAPTGEMYAVDWFNHRIQKFDAAGNFLLSFGGYASNDGSLIFPRGVAVAPNGNVVVMDSENNRIDVFTSGGSFLSKIKPPTGQTQFLRPHQVAIASDGTYWVADTGNNRIVHINSSGTVLHNWTGGGQLNQPRGVAVDASGNVYVSSGGNHRVLKFSTTGTLLATLASQGNGPTNVQGPYGLRIVGTGANAMLLIADAGNNRVVAMSLTGVAIATFGAAGSGNGQFSSPRGMDRSPITGEIAVADFLNNRLSIWTTS